MREDKKIVLVENFVLDDENRADAGGGNKQRKEEKESFHATG